MIDREKLIKGLECCVRMNSRLDERYCDDCPYNYQSDGTCASLSPLLEDALALLKEQNPKRMWVCNGEFYCPQCGAVCKSYYHYCDECGQAVKWK